MTVMKKDEEEVPKMLEGGCGDMLHVNMPQKSHFSIQTYPSTHVAPFKHGSLLQSSTLV